MTGMRCTRNLVTNESPSLGSHQASPRKLCTDRANLSLGLGGKKPKLLITEIKTPDSSKSYQVKWLKLKPKLNLKFEKLYAESVNCKLTSFQGPGQKKRADALQESHFETAGISGLFLNLGLSCIEASLQEDVTTSKATFRPAHRDQLQTTFT